MVSFHARDVALDDLVLDPNNYRFKNPGSKTEVATRRFVEEKVQEQALKTIKDDGISELKLSIIQNGFVPVEKIVVREIQERENEPNVYVVVEGNRRTAALKILQKEHAGGVDLPESVVQVFERIQVLVVEQASQDDLLAIMGIRHVGGPKEWGGYQSARLVFQLLQQNELTAREVASKLGLTVNEVNRRHRAFSALTQMTNDDGYGDVVTPEMYPVFHEVVGQPKVRAWLGWDDEEFLFTDKPNRELLYTWMTGGDELPAQVTSFRHVRALKQVMDNDDAFTALKDEDQTLEQAVAIANADARATKWLPNVRVALKSLNEMSSETVENLDDDSLAILGKLRARARAIIRGHEVAAENDESDDEE